MKVSSGDETDERSARRRNAFGVSGRSALRTSPELLR
jgi:hypothetical protein